MSIRSKSKSPKARRNSHRANRKIGVPDLVKCSKCGALVIPHKVCKVCGSHNKREVISIED